MLLLGGHGEEDDFNSSPPAESQSVSGQEVDIRVGIGSQILSMAGVTRIRCLSSHKGYKALEGFGLRVSEFVSCSSGGRANLQ